MVSVNYSLNKQKTSNYLERRHHFNQYFSLPIKKTLLTKMNYYRMKMGFGILKWKNSKTFKGNAKIIPHPHLTCPRGFKTFRLIAKVAGINSNGEIRYYKFCHFDYFSPLLLNMITECNYLSNAYVKYNRSSLPWERGALTRLQEA